MNKKIKYEDLRRIFRDFFNDSYYSIDREKYVPHAGKDGNCVLCKIENKAIKKLRKLISKTHNPKSKDKWIKVKSVEEMATKLGL